MVRGTTSELIGLSLADLTLWLDARGSGVQMAVPACHTPFLVAGAPESGLILRVREASPLSTEGWQPLYNGGAETWQLWRDGAGRQVFVVSRHSPPPRQVVVDADLRAGEVLGEFGAPTTAGPGQASGAGVYPLQDIDMVLFANWLAQTGDLIVHAAGIVHEGAGYAFVGPSGAGKSTFVTQALAYADVTVLGEDQVILRHLDGRFLMYGTPWHTSRSRCSAGGVPLKRLFFLDRAVGHAVKPCAPRTGIERLLRDAFVPYYNRAGVVRILDNLAGLAEQVPFHTLGFRLGADPMELVSQA